MADRFEYGRNDYLNDQIEYYVDQARFVGTYGSSPERLQCIADARLYDEPMDLETWQEIARSYPSFPLVAETISRHDNEDIPVRAYHLEKALSALLDLASAPPHMVADLKLLLGHFTPRGAIKYGEAQRALIENPRATVTEISRLSGLDRSTIHHLLRKGVLVQPDKE